MTIKSAGVVVPKPTYPLCVTRNSEAPVLDDERSNRSVEPLPWMASIAAPVVVLIPTFLLAVSILNTVVDAPFWIWNAVSEEIFCTNEPSAAKYASGVPPAENKLNKLPVWLTPAVISTPELPVPCVVSTENTELPLPS